MRLGLHDFRNPFKDKRGVFIIGGRDLIVVDLDSGKPIENLVAMTWGSANTRCKEEPPSHLMGINCAPIPEWGEAINILRRAGLLEPDEFGHYNGTDFALQANVSILWWCLVDLLIETGRIKHSWVDDEIRDRGAESRESKRLLFENPPLAVVSRPLVVEIPKENP